MRKRTLVLTVFIAFLMTCSALNIGPCAAQSTAERSGDTNAIPSDPTLYFTPENGTYTTDHVVTFGWCVVEGAQKYLLQVDNDSDFSSPEFETYLVETQLTTSDSLLDGRYYWRVKAYKADNEDVWLWSGVAEFTIFTIGERSNTDLGIAAKQQRKDTKMLCLGGCSLTGDHTWDTPHVTRGCSHDDWYCARASISMINSYYGGSLSQDRISYYVLEERNGDGVPEGDLGHLQGFSVSEITDGLSWALNGATITFQSGKPPFNQITLWIDAHQPFIRGHAAHATVIDGYESEGQLVHVIDPWTGTESAISYDTLGFDIGVWVPPTGAITARSDEASLTQDSDNDGVIDFDEINRFNTGPNDGDSDDDLVGDKEEIRCYTFESDDSFDSDDSRKPDPDGDGLRVELDVDSDNGGLNDGMEDLNRNGRVDPNETDPLDETDDYYFTLHAVLSTYPYWGERGGYHAIMKAVQEELAKIGINLELHFYDPGTVWNIVWDEKWNVSGAPPDGWDLTTGEGWLDPPGIKRLPSLAYSSATPPLGYNIMDWQNYKSDELLLAGMQTLDTDVYRDYLWAFQELYMHDPPTVNMYWGIVYEAHNIHLVGYDPVVGPNYDTPNYYFEDGQETLTWAFDSDMWNTNPVLMTTHTQDAVDAAIFEGLYLLGRETPLALGEYPDPAGLASKPQLAAVKHPIYYDGGRTAVIPLRDDVYWSDDVKFNASDVKCTFDAILDSATGSRAWADFAPIIDSVEILTNETLQTYTYPGTTTPLWPSVYEPYAVQFNLYEPYHDFELLLCSAGGGMIVPWHVMKDIPHSAWRVDPTNSDPSLLPGTGPFMFDKWVPDDHVTLVRNPNYNRPMRGDDLNKPINTIIIKIIPDPAAMKSALETLAIDLAPALAAPVEWFEGLKTTGTHEVYQWFYPAANNIFFNLDSPILSNRYVRMAIAHAIPYPTILEDILPTWGVEGSWGTGPIPPYQFHEAYNPNLVPYEYNITKAQQYLNMWLYSQAAYAPPGSPEVDLGPVGDTDFSGFVELPDFFPWMRNFGTTPDQWPWSPGHDIDPDFDNSEFVELDDFYMWTGAWGKYYPFRSARSPVTPLAAEYPSIYVEPAAIEGAAYEPGTAFTVSIRTNYTGSDVWGWQFTLYYNASILFGVNVANGDIITGGTATFIAGDFDNVAGELSLTGAFFDFSEEPAPLTSGPGILANVTFVVRGWGDSGILLGDKTKLIGVTEDGWGTDYNIVDAFTMPGHIQQGFFSNLPLTIRPNASGTFTRWTAYPSETPNWQCVDEVSANDDADYVYWTPQPSKQDSYNLEDHTTETGNISNVRVVMYAKLAAADDDQITIELVINGTPYEGVTVSPTTTYDQYTSNWPINPSTGSAWTWSDIDALEAGFKCLKVGPTSPEHRITQLYVEVTYG